MWGIESELFNGYVESGSRMSTKNRVCGIPVVESLLLNPCPFLHWFGRMVWAYSPGLTPGAAVLTPVVCHTHLNYHIPGWAFRTPEAMSFIAAVLSLGGFLVHISTDMLGCVRMSSC